MPTGNALKCDKKGHLFYNKVTFKGLSSYGKMMWKGFGSKLFGIGVRYEG